MRTPEQIRKERQARQAKARVENLKFEEDRKAALAAQTGQVSSIEHEESQQAEPKAVPSFCPTEELFEAETVHQIAERFLGRELDSFPQIIRFAAGDGEVCLSLSNSEKGYYRTTEESCTCKGWYFSAKRFGVGACRHHNLAFPADAEHNARRIQEIKAANATAANVRMRAADSTTSLIQRGGFKPFLEA